LKALQIMTIACAKAWNYTDDAIQYNFDTCKREQPEVTKLFKGG